MRTFILVFFSLGIIVAWLYGLWYYMFLNQDRVCFEEACVFVEVADTRSEKRQGLQGVEELLELEWMLFVFDEKDKHQMRTKDMKISIDMLWLNKEWVVVDIEENVLPCEDWDSCVAYTPDSGAKYVLETSSGFVENHNIKINDTAELYY